MNKYDVYASCDVPHYTTFQVEAATVEEALDKAKAQVHDETPQMCGGEYEWHEIEVCGEHGDEFMRCREPQRAAQIAAPAILKALQLGVIAARKVLARRELGDPAETIHALADWLAQAESAVQEASGINR